MTLALVPYQGDLLAQSRLWAGLSDAELRRRAVEAARDKDAQALEGLVVAYLVHSGQQGVSSSPRTVEAYRLGVRQLVAFAEMQAWNLLHPGRRAPQDYVAWMGAQGRKSAGVQLKVAAASCLYRALRWADATDADPFRDVKVPRDRTAGIEKRPEYSEDDLHSVVECADVHAKFLLFLTAHAGLRISEALALSWADLDEGARRVHVRRGKGGKARTVAMSGSLSRACRHYRSLYGPGGPEHFDGRRATSSEQVFRYGTQQTARYHLKKAFAEAGVTFRGFHPGRKYAGTRLVQQIKDFGRVAAHLGHASVDTTRKGYARLAADDLKDDLSGW